MLKIGDKVKVMYPYDAIWWETEGIILECESRNNYLVQNVYGDKVMIDIGYLDY